jgi:hypothetical protein
VPSKRKEAVSEFHVPMPRLGSVVAEREYRLVSRSRKRQKVRLRFGKPRASPGGHGYRCVFEIEGLNGPGSRITRYGGGTDSLQALHLTMEMASLDLLYSDAYKERRLTWYGFYELGLPLNEGTKRLVHKDPKAERAMKKMLDLLDPEGEYHPRPRKRQPRRGARKNRA